MDQNTEPWVALIVLVVAALAARWNGIRKQIKAGKAKEEKTVRIFGKTYVEVKTKK